VIDVLGPSRTEQRLEHRVGQDAAVEQILEAVDRFLATGMFVERRHRSRLDQGLSLLRSEIASTAGPRREADSYGRVALGDPGHCMAVMETGIHAPHAYPTAGRRR
jgi:hypothetical protein